MKNVDALYHVLSCLNIALCFRALTWCNPYHSRFIWTQDSLRVYAVLWDLPRRVSALVIVGAKVDSVEIMLKLQRFSEIHFWNIWTI